MASSREQISGNLLTAETRIAKGERVDLQTLIDLEPGCIAISYSIPTAHTLQRLIYLYCKIAEPSFVKLFLVKLRDRVDNPDHIRLLLSKNFADLGEYAVALTEIAPFLDERQLDPVIFNRAAEIFRGLGRVEESVPLQRRAAELDKRFRSELLSMLTAMDAGAEAIAVARDVLNDPDIEPRAVHAAFATLRRFSGSADALADTLELCQRLLSGVPDAALWRARLYRSDRQFDRALEELEAAINSGAGGADYVRERAMVAYSLGFWGRDAKALWSAVPLLRPSEAAAERIASVDALFRSFGGSLEVAAAETGRFEHVKSPESVFEVLLRSARQPSSTEAREGLVMIGGSFAAGGAERIGATLFREFARDEGLLPVKLYMSDISPENGSDFYLPLTDLAPSDVAVLNRNSPVKAPFSLLREDQGKTAQAIYDLLVRDRPKIVHISQEPLTVFGGLAAVLAGVPRIVLHTHNMRPPIVHPHLPLSPRLRDCYRELLRRPEVALVCCAQAAIDDYSDWIEVPDAKNMYAVHNGIFFDEIAVPAGEARPANAKTPFLVGTAFMFRPEKRPMLWVDAAEAVLSKLPNVRFVMFGDGPLWTDTKDHIAHKGLEKYFALPGLVPNFPQIAGMLDLFVLSSATEALPNVLVEAQAAGVPVVSFDVGGVGETMIGGQTGILVQDQTAEALAAAIENALVSPGWHEQASAVGPGFVREKFSIGKMVYALRCILVAANC